MSRIYCFLALVLLVLSLSTLVLGRSGRTYVSGDEVLVYADKMSPSANPYETYDYQEAPGCTLLESNKALTLGELLAGDNSYMLQTDIRFQRNADSSILCNFKGTEADVEKLKDYIKHNYNYELSIDEMPIWGAIGKVNSDLTEYSIYVHRTFYIGIHNDHIVNVTLKTESPVKLTAGVVYEFTYSVVFDNSPVEYVNRFSTVFETRYAGSRTRLASIINSVLVIFFLLCVIMLIITRTFRTDSAKIEQESHLSFDGQDIIDEAGWRCLYADVFRVPRHTSIFCAILGCGSQLLLLAAIGIVLSVISNYRISLNHNLATYTVLGYVFTSSTAGYVSGYQFMGCGLLAPPMASKWIRAFHVTFMIAPVTYALSYLPSVLIAIFYGSAQVPHLKGVIIVVALWGLIAYPLCLAGVLCSRYIFRRTERRRNIPHVNQIPRLIPRPPRKLLAPRTLLLISGVLPFMSIFVEFSFVFKSLWSYKVFHLYGFLTITTALYVAVTACVAVAATFLLLTTENHHWKWMSIGFGASSSFYVFVYAVYFYFFKTSMYGLYMWVVYFSYCVTFSLLLAVVGGTIGYFSASFFVKRIYGQSKHD